MLREGEGEEGVCMHERKLVVATKVRGLCGSKRLTKIIIWYESRFIYLNRRSWCFKHCMHEYSGDTRDVHMLYHNVIMHGVCNSQLNAEQSKPYYTSNNLTFYLNL